jgi:hypothetical protein
MGLTRIGGFVKDQKYLEKNLEFLKLFTNF